MDLFKGAYGYFSIINAPQINRAVTLFGTIYLGYSTFHEKNGSFKSDAVLIILHEMSHIFDYRSGNGNPGASNEFNGSFNSSSCTPGYLGCSRNDAPDIYGPVNKLTGGSGTYTAKGKTSGYGQTSSIDDFADSMAVEILKVNGIKVNIFIDDDRLKFIIKILENSKTHSR